jgi:hypothetical protein
MAISYIAGTGSATGGAVTSISWPVGSVAAGRLAIVAIINKSYNSNPDIADAGWTPILIDFANGAVANSADGGSVQLRVWARVLDGSESGSISFGASASNVWMHSLTVYENATGLWDLAAATAAVVTRSATAGSDPGIAADDWLYVCYGGPGDNFGTPAFDTLTAAGVTFGTTDTRRASITNSGFDACILITTTPVTAGPSSGAPVFTYTSGSTNGSVGFVRIREQASGGSVSVNLSGSPANATAAAVDPTAVLGDLSVTPSEATASASAVSPTPVLGSLLIGPDAASAAASAVSPTPVLGSVAVSPDAAVAAASAVSPSIAGGGVVVDAGATPAGATAAGVSPAVVLGSVAITPAAAVGTATAVSPSVNPGADDIARMVCFALPIVVQVTVTPRAEIDSEGVIATEPLGREATAASPTNEAAGERFSAEW